MARKRPHSQLKGLQIQDSRKGEAPSPRPQNADIRQRQGPKHPTLHREADLPLRTHSSPPSQDCVGNAKHPQAKELSRVNTQGSPQTWPVLGAAGAWLPLLSVGQRLDTELRFGKCLSALTCLAPLGMFSSTFFSSPRNTEIKADPSSENKEPAIQNDLTICYGCPARKSQSGADPSPGLSLRARDRHATLRHWLEWHPSSSVPILRTAQNLQLGENPSLLSSVECT